MLPTEPKNEIQKTEFQIHELIKKLGQLRRDSPPQKVENYTFKNTNGEVSLLELFGDKEVLFAIHNMGQGCRYCTLWADGINGFVSHLEDRFALVVLSKDAPEQQRRFANSRGWRFQLASHGGGDYIREQSAIEGGDNIPGMVCYTRKGSEIYKKNFTGFGPGDIFCSVWHILNMAGYGEENWTPQFNYWQRPTKLDDGGENYGGSLN